MFTDGGFSVQEIHENRGAVVGQGKAHEYFRELVEQRTFPAPPAVASKALGMIEDPDMNIRVLCKVLSDDPALAARILAIARSVHYGQRVLPTNLQSAVQVMGLRDLRNVIISITLQALFKSSGYTSETLWAHSLAVALAARLLSSAVGHRDSEQAYLAGLLHDAGQMIFLNGDPAGFSKHASEARQKETPLVELEPGIYGFDHAFIGAALLEFWNFDPEICRAVHFHHNHKDVTKPDSLSAVLIMADFLACRAGFGFYVPAPLPAPENLRSFGFDNEEMLAQAVQELRQAFSVESALHKTA
jgi:putative nucleotidyltransferase with HDIG domain